MSATETKGDWLVAWDPEDESKWDKKLAWNTLTVSTFTLTLCFVAWFLPSAIVPKLNALGFEFTKAQLYWLAAMPGLAGGGLRLVWMFLPPIMGTRQLVWLSTALLLIPLLGWGIAVTQPNPSSLVPLLPAFLPGIGGGVFSGFMPSTSYFFPRAKQGTALGVQAGVGNFGAVTALDEPWGGRPASVELTLPPLAGLWLAPRG